MAFERIHWVVPATLMVAAALIAPTAGATIFMPLDRTDLVGHADVIAYGEVVSTSSYWNEDPRIIMTGVNLRVTEVDKGGRVKTGDTIRLVTFGGKVGNKRMPVPGFPKYTAGTRAYLFLQVDRSGDYRVIGGPQGRLDVRTDSRTGHDYVLGLGSDISLMTPDRNAVQKVGQGTQPPAFADLLDGNTKKLWLRDVRRAVRSLLDTKKDNQ